jgi:hypothetical protein
MELFPNRFGQRNQVSVGFGRSFIRLKKSARALGEGGA